MVRPGEATFDPNIADAQGRRFTTNRSSVQFSLGRGPATGSYTVAEHTAVLCGMVAGPLKRTFNPPISMEGSMPIPLQFHAHNPFRPRDRRWQFASVLHQGDRSPRRRLDRWVRLAMRPQDLGDASGSRR
jgi:hypothetical protein